MTDYPAGTVEVRGTEYPVTVSDLGTWRATLNGSTLSGDTKDSLRDRMMKATARAAAKVTVPFEMLSVGQFSAPTTKTGVATGIHSKNNNLLVKWDGRNGRPGSSEQLDRYTSKNIFRPLTDTERQRLILLFIAKQKATKDYEAYESSLTIDLKKAVEAAIDAATNPQNDLES